VTRFTVVGAGPAGFYTTEKLLNAGVDVDLLDVLPTPFGLVRAGIAPDHPKIKSVTRVYEKTAAHERFRFYGGVEFGADVHRAELLDRYDGVVYAVGTSSDNQLNVPGEDRPGSHSATEFVAWYNGHPAQASQRFDLAARRAVVIGNGNVALDIARMLVLDPDELRRTDVADHALEALARSRVEEVVVLGRRGPAQASFTTPELRELGDLGRAEVVVDGADLELDEHSAAWLDSPAAGAGAKRNVDLLRDYAARPRRGADHSIHLRFLCSPLSLEGEEGGPVTAIRIARNRMERGRPVPTGEQELLECGLVIRAIGYRGAPLPDVPFDRERGTIRNVGGRVVGDDGRPLPAEYVVGWIKRGPTGVIGTNKKDAADTVARILEDLDAGRLGETAAAAQDDVDAWLHECVPTLVTWDGWEAIDRRECGDGAPQGRPRVKLVRVPEMLDVAQLALAAGGE
jgi:ferredoxin--NADP+ reductase